MPSVEELAKTPEFERILDRVAGEHGGEVVRVVLEKDKPTDEEIANETGIRLNLVRKILYDLYENRVMDYKRDRDDSTGWYSYHWHVEPDRALELFNENKRTLLRKLKERLEHERETMFFTCSKDCPKGGVRRGGRERFQLPQLW